MRNILTLLTLFLLAFASTNAAIAIDYDESKRTERLGLSYYDGRPLYVVMFGYTGGIKPGEPAVGYSMAYYRVYTGDNLKDFGDTNFTASGAQGRAATARYGDVTVSERYFYGLVDSDGLLVFSNHPSYTEPYTGWSRKLLERFPPPEYDEGDIGVFVFDSIAERVKTWVLAALIFAGGYCCVKFGFREMLRFAGSGIGGKADASLTSDVSNASSDREVIAAERENLEAFRRSWNAIRELGEADAYATGEAYGLTFTAKVVKSNQILQESWARLSEEERQFLTNEARALAWQDDLIDEKERIYRQTVMNSALLDLEGVDASTMYSNPYGDDATEEDEDPEQVPRPGAAPLPYPLLEEEEDE